MWRCWAIQRPLAICQPRSGSDTVRSPLRNAYTNATVPRMRNKRRAKCDGAVTTAFTEGSSTTAAVGDNASRSNQNIRVQACSRLYLSGWNSRQWPAAWTAYRTMSALEVVRPASLDRAVCFRLDFESGES